MAHRLRGVSAATLAMATVGALAAVAATAAPALQEPRCPITATPSRCADVEGCAWCPARTDHLSGSDPQQQTGSCKRATERCPRGIGRAPDDEYTTEALVAKLARGAWFGEEAGVPADFECAWRKGAIQHASTLQPFLSSAQRKDLYDALQLQACNVALESVASAVKQAPGADGTAPRMPCHRDSRCIAVSTAAGLRAALGQIAAARHLGASSSTLPDAVWEVRMAPGVYRLNETMVIGPDHSGTAITAPDGGVTITGNAVLTLQWKKVSTSKGVSAYAADVPAGMVIDALRVDGHRATRARFPNANPETDQFPTGWIKGSKSLPPTFPTTANAVTIPLPGAYPGSGSSDHWGQYGFNGAYRTGYGGACSHLTPAESYWCQPDGRVAGRTYFVRTPSGIADAAAQLPHSPYAGGAPNATVFYWRPGHWFTIMYGLAKPMSNDLVFGRGGFQGAEGHDTVAEWYIENVEEELDAPNEFFHDVVNSRLLLIYNGTGAPPAEVEVPLLTELILLKGTQEAPVKNVSIAGITFTGQKPTYLEPHGHPSGGDWGLERVGAIRLNGTEGVTIDRCLFTRLDGNAIFLDGYSRNATISKSEFTSLGCSAIALWGYEDKGYGTAGNQPRYTAVTENVCHELGIYQKQSSCFFQAVAGASTVTNNIFYNGPRAMVNFNDNFFGGHMLTDNLIFNSCRESSDHGAFNSWNRQPYATKALDGKTVSAQPAYSTLGRNFIVANYAADGGCYDNDDGSSWYLEQDNFCVFGGMKSNFEGSNKRSTGNLHAFASVYGDHCLSGLNQINDFYADGYANNTCILSKAGDTYLGIGSQPGSSTACNPANSSTIHLQIGGNTVYAPGGLVTVTCGGTLNGTMWLSHGVDVGSKILDSASLTSAEIVAMGFKALKGEL
mmetsp:Transcript_4480/g.11420  ORF Transcript_4480/g.11420 Transcript_4480/m.11420 type:complete len:899 (+) Transcript_4480:19-2715(+)